MIWHFVYSATFFWNIRLTTTYGKLQIVHFAQRADSLNISSFTRWPLVIAYTPAICCTGACGSYTVARTVTARTQTRTGVSAQDSGMTSYWRQRQLETQSINGNAIRITAGRPLMLIQGHTDGLLAQPTTPSPLIGQLPNQPTTSHRCARKKLKPIMANATSAVYVTNGFILRTQNWCNLFARKIFCTSMRL